MKWIEPPRPYEPVYDSHMHIDAPPWVTVVATIAMCLAFILAIGDHAVALSLAAAACVLGVVFVCARRRNAASPLTVLRAGLAHALRKVRVRF